MSYNLEQALTQQAIGIMYLDLVQDQAAWSEANFGSTEERGPIGPLKHMAKEINELLENPTDPHEYADLLILLLDSSRRAGIDAIDLIAFALDKMELNKKRKWSKPVEGEPCEHIRTES